MSKNSIISIILLFCCAIYGLSDNARAKSAHDLNAQNNNAQKAFEEAESEEWQEVFSDSGTKDWNTHWFLDGEVGVVSNSKKGMQMTAGPNRKKEAHHMVLWTKESFQGDLRIDYEYTRLDSQTHGANIIYIQATGRGKEPYVKDISKWNHLRRVPMVRKYFNHMNAYQISYAAYQRNAKEYIRGRRYMPNKRRGLKGTKLTPDCFPNGLFETNMPHQITIIKKPQDLYMRVKNAEQTYYCHMKNQHLPEITEGRIGLRQMYTRSARYKNFSIKNTAD